jgi:hypothetical protein
MKPLIMSSVTPPFANPAPRQRTEKRNKLLMNILLRPKRSAIRANNSKKDPDDNEVAAESQIISAVDISRSLPINDEFTVTIPVVMELMPTAIVAVRTTNISWYVDVKHDGRPP